MRCGRRWATHAPVSVMCSTGGPGGPGNRIAGPGSGAGLSGSGTTTVFLPAGPGPDPLSIVYSNVRVPGTDPGEKATARRAAWYSASLALPVSVTVSPATVPGIAPE